MITVDLSLIALQLEGLEETIISRLIDRAQFRRNGQAYLAGRSGFAGEPDRSLFALRLRYQEEIDSLFGRFEVPEERPFTRDLPPPRREVHLPPSPLRIDRHDDVNLTGEILERYLQMLPRLCPEGDDGQYGSSVEHDVSALQAIGRRIHYGALFVAESKFRGDPDGYRRLIADGDVAGIEERLTRREVEERILVRVREKVEGWQASANPKIRNLVPSGEVVSFYRETVIPLTKRGEVQYLLSLREHG